MLEADAVEALTEDEDALELVSAEAGGEVGDYLGRALPRFGSRPLSAA